MSQLTRFVRRFRAPFKAAPRAAFDFSKPRKSALRPEMLDEFVRQSDALGGPTSLATQEYFDRWEYKSEHQVVLSKDPYGEAYLHQQLRVYSEVSGRSFNQEKNELTDFDLPAHVAAANAYNHPDPAGLALHMARLSLAFRLASGQRGAKLLDMGCGWGLSSELAATLGFDVTAVDINPRFVSLVNQRAQRLGLPIRSVRSSFDDFTTDERQDLVLFYECLHHAVQPWVVIDKMRRLLAPGGKILLAGEPINHIWWKDWGIRLDALSIYCIRKFGWFESGWSLPFIRQCLEMSGLDCEIIANPDPQIGKILIATDRAVLPIEWLERNARLSGFHKEKDKLVSQSSATIVLGDSYTSGTLTLSISNGCGTPANLSTTINGAAATRSILVPGINEVAFRHLPPGGTIQLKSEGRIPVQGVRWEPDSPCQPMRKCA